MKKEIIPMCGCGYGTATHAHNNSKDLLIHKLGEGNCCRKIATGELIPKDFRIENGIEICNVNGYAITKYTLINQRLYGQDENGIWSLPKNEESTVSLVGNY